LVKRKTSKMDSIEDEIIAAQEKIEQVNKKKVDLEYHLAQLLLQKKAILKLVVYPEREYVYCDQVKPISEAEFMKLSWKKIGCAHPKGDPCSCECHTYVSISKEETK